MSEVLAQLEKKGGNGGGEPVFVNGVYHTRIAPGEGTIRTLSITEKQNLYFAIQVVNNATSAYTSVSVNSVEIGRVTSPSANQSGFGILSADVENGDVVTIKTWGNSNTHRTDTTCITFKI